MLGATAFVVAPLLQTWLMSEAGPAAAGLVAAVNISVFGLAGALGAGLGGAVLAAGLGLAGSARSPRSRSPSGPPSQLALVRTRRALRSC